MVMSVLKKFIIWIIFIIITVALIPFAIVFRMPVQTKEEKSKSTSRVNVYFHNDDTVKEMMLDEYIVGVVCAEMPASFELEALKAQAVATRSYTISKINASSDDTVMQHKGADICTDFAHCQAYTSKDEAYDSWGSNAKKYYEKIENAVFSTSDEIITYEGEVINAVFHASNGGRTENSKDVWGGDLPYLTSVESFGEALAPKYKSNVTLKTEEFKKILSSQYPDIKFDKLIGESTFTSGGSVSEIELGNKKIKGTDVRKLFGLYSANFSAKIKDDSIIFNVSGHGHGVGMSQYGANAMAADGKSYTEILSKYYTDTKISTYIKP